MAGPLLAELSEVDVFGFEWELDIDSSPAVVLANLAVQKDLKMTIGQLGQFKAVRTKLAKAGLIDEDLEITEQPLDDPDPTDESLQVYQECRAILDEKQQHRFDQLLLQHYVSAFPIVAHVQFNRMLQADISPDKKASELAGLRFHATCEAARHFRLLKGSIAVCEQYMENRTLQKLMHPPYKPRHGHPDYESPLFFEIGVSKPKAKNPRRQRRLK